MLDNPLGYVLKLITNTFSIKIADDVGIPTENGVLLLTQANFKEAISYYDTLLVKFYLPTCPRCKLFGIEYTRMAQKLSANGSKITLGQVDAEAEKALIKQYKITGYPAIKLFKNGTTVTYYGTKQADHIMAWLQKNCPECY